MTVICIDGKPNTAFIHLPEGVQLEATQAPGPSDEDYFIIAGYERDTDGMLVYWGKRRFIPVSNIDETQFERTYNKEIV